MNTLYNIKTRLVELVQSDELTDAEKEELGVILGQELTQKSTGIIGFVRNAEASETALDAEIERLQKIKKANAEKMNRFREYVKENMQALGLEKIETPIGILRVQKNPISVEILDEEQVPEEYKKVKTTISVDKKSITDNFKETGEIVPGTRIITGKTSLRVI